MNFELMLLLSAMPTSTIELQVVAKKLDHNETIGKDSVFHVGYFTGPKNSQFKKPLTIW
jgi:hypothetical protein